MATPTEYHLKELVWFHGWTPSHWILVETEGGLKAHCTRVEIGHVEDRAPSQPEVSISPEMLARIEKARPGSLPAIMGFDFLLCEGEPGSAVLNRPMNFSPANANPAQGIESR
jgi:hypothetical protein